MSSAQLLVAPSTSPFENASYACFAVSVLPAIGLPWSYAFSIPYPELPGRAPPGARPVASPTARALLRRPRRRGRRDVEELHAPVNPVRGSRSGRERARRRQQARPVRARGLRRVRPRVPAGDVL